jgi:hypothetical protein
MGTAECLANIRCLLKLMEENAVLNVSTPNLHIAEYDWGEMPNEVPVAEADLILAADCVYFEVRPSSVRDYD